MINYIETTEITGLAKIFLQDNRQVMKTFPDASIDLILTDPPYMRTINDGSTERALSELFKTYCEKYRYSHPVVSKALEYISNEYFREYESDKEYSITGKF